MPMLGPLAALLLLQPASQPAPRSATYAADGRLAAAIDGDIWISAAPVSARDTAAIRWIRVTSGAAWDREPSWTPDGRALVFSSDRAGSFDVWRVRVGPNGSDGEPEQLTKARDADREPTATSDGRIVFVRGEGPAARLWIRLADGTKHRLGAAQATERWPAFSPDGARLAYVALDERGATLHVRRLAGDSVRGDDVVATTQSPERPTWSPDGKRLAYATRTGVYVAPLDGRYSNLVSTRYAAPAWSADGRSIALASIETQLPGYNGDPDRLHDQERDVGERLRGEGTLWTIDAPAPVDTVATTRALVLDRPRAARNTEAFERAWSRTNALYYAAPDERHAAWEKLRDRYRADATAATSDSALDAVIHRMFSERPPLRASATGRAAVSSAHPTATAAGVEILGKGGNVVDAAVAVSFALGVVEPDASGVGGYGQMVVFKQGMAKPAVIEFMGRAPEDATLANGTLLTNGRYPDDGPVLPVVPGTVAGMYTAWKKFGSGKVPWADLVAPAIRAAKDGYAVSEGLATTLATERVHFTKYAGSRALFFRDGRPVVAGDTVKNPDLAWVLEQIAARGMDGFYKGEVARRLVQDLHGQGNAMRLTDMARYFAPERDAVGGTYRGYGVWSSAPPVSGGATLVSQLQILEQLAPNAVTKSAPAPYADDAAKLHAMIAAWQLVPSSRGRIADPGLWPVDVTPFVSRDTAQARARCFDATKALGPDTFRGDSLACAAPKRTASIETRTSELESPCGEGHALEMTVCHAAGTTAFAVADAAGNAVAVTQTLGTWGGNFYVSPGLGFLYNDKLTTYGSDPNEYGARLPYARHGSTLAPTLVLEGSGASQRPVLAVGAAGNAWITSAVYQTLVGVIDNRLDAQRALEQPRFLLGGRGGAGARGASVQVEDGLAPGVVQKLRAMGYRLDFISLPGELRMGYGAAVTLGRSSVTAGADPRRAGAAGAVP